jgi:hypothetical protein
MSESVRENLLGYLLDALEPEEAEQVHQALQQTPRLNAELESLAAHLAELEFDRDLHHPPPGLAANTCRWLAVQLDDESTGDAVADAFDPPSAHASQVMHQPAGTDESSQPRPRLAPVSSREGEAFRNWSFADFFVAGGIALAAAFLFLPALAHSRFDAQRQACQNNLRQLGFALASYAEVNSGSFPRIPTEGNRAFAGIFVPLLKDGGFLADSTNLSCPASDVVSRHPQWSIPKLTDIDTAQGESWAELKSSASGGFGYNVGWIQGDQYRGVVNRQRPFFAIASDAPSQLETDQQSDNHGRRGQNVLYEDGHYRFLQRCSGSECVDDLFRNRAGRVAPGLDENDTVIVRGETSMLDLLRGR